MKFYSNNHSFTAYQLRFCEPRRIRVVARFKEAYAPDVNTIPVRAPIRRTLLPNIPPLYYLRRYCSSPRYLVDMSFIINASHGFIITVKEALPCSFSQSIKCLSRVIVDTNFISTRVQIILFCCCNLIMNNNFVVFWNCFSNFFFYVCKKYNYSNVIYIFVFLGNV